MKFSSSFDESYVGWKQWDENCFGYLKPSTRRYYAAELNRAGVLDRKGLAVLEIGFGNGAFLTFCREREWTVVGTEMIPELVSVAGQAGYNALHAIALSDLPPEDFDLIVSMDVLEHVPADEAILFLTRMLRVLRPGGTIVLHFPNGDSPFGLYNQHGDATHVNVIGSGKARYYAQMAGADVVLLTGEAQPVPAGSVAHTMHRLAAWPVRKILNLLVRSIFLPGTSVDFSASALTMVLRKPS